METPPDALPDKVKIVVDEVLKEQGFEDAEISVNLFKLKGENYLGNIYSVQAAVSGKKIELIVKVAPALENLRSQFPVDMFYAREFFIYENVLAEFEKLERNAGIPKHERIHFPKCYKTYNEYLSETLVMEDLKASGFKIFGRFNKYDFEHARLTLEAIGKYHALSFVLQRDDPEKYASYAENMKEKMLAVDATQDYKEKMNSLFQASVTVAIQNLESDRIKEKLLKFSEDLYDRMAGDLTPKGINVLSHGDCWSNNMMYKYKDGKPVQICLLDFQISRYASPVLDIMYFIFCCTDQDLRKEHYDDMLKAYHDSLRDYLARFSMDVEKCYPWSTMMQDLKTITNFPLCAAISNTLTFSTAAESIPTFEDFTPDMDWTNIPAFQNKPSEQYTYKINGLLEDFDRFGYF